MVIVASTSITNSVPPAGRRRPPTLRTWPPPGRPSHRPGAPRRPRRRSVATPFSPTPPARAAPPDLPGRRSPQRSPRRPRPRPPDRRGAYRHSRRRSARRRLGDVMRQDGGGRRQRGEAAAPAQSSNRSPVGAVRAFPRRRGGCLDCVQHPGQGLRRQLLFMINRGCGQGKGRGGPVSQSSQLFTRQGRCPRRWRRCDG